MKLKEDKHWKTSKAKLLGGKKVLVSLANNNLPENSWGAGVRALHNDELRGRWAGWGDNELTASNCAGWVEPRARITETPPKSLHKCTNRWLLKKQGNNVEVFLWLKNLHKALKQSFGGDFFLTYVWSVSYCMIATWGFRDVLWFYGLVFILTCSQEILAPLHLHPNLSQSLVKMVPIMQY